ncbi:MAG: hypothetical protein JWN04_2596 [Myxococcaceae bacterium]|nr:hypothetical protein [Myxococcaceae bacterium]
MSACARSRPPFVAPAVRAPLRHRPLWTRSLSVDIDSMARCLDGRAEPASVLYVYHDPSRAVAITTLDAHGAIEHCVIDEGRVVVRQPGEETVEDFGGLPLFSLGATRPAIAERQTIEQVAVEGHVMGWLYWLPEGSSHAVDWIDGEDKSALEQREEDQP